MTAKYAKMMNQMKEMAADLGNQQQLFLNDEAALAAISEAIRSLEGSAAQMRSAWNKHSNEPNPLTTTTKR